MDGLNEFFTQSSDVGLLAQTAALTLGSSSAAAASSASAGWTDRIIERATTAATATILSFIPEELELGERLAVVKLTASGIACCEESKQK